jgi:hypothetical protein
MPHRDHTTRQDGDPPVPGLERAYRSCLDADARPAIRAATTTQLRAAVTGIAGHLCRRLRLDMTEFLPPGPAPAGSWGICTLSG